MTEPKNGLANIPPLPSSVLRGKEERRVKTYSALYQAVNKGRRRSKDPDEDLLLEAQDAARRQDLPRLQKASEDIKSASSQSGFMERLFRTLESAALPFEAFAEGIASIAGVVVPQKAFRERSERSRGILSDLFTGQLDLAEAAGALRSVHRERSMIEQLILDAFFDPLNLVPGGFIGRSLQKAGAKKLGTVAKYTLGPPLVPDRLLPNAFRMTPRRASDMLRHEINVAKRLGEDKGLGELVPAGGADESYESYELSRALGSLKGQSVSDQAAGVPLTPEQRLKKALDTSIERGDLRSEVVIRLSAETAGRDWEIGRLRVKDFLPVTREIIFRPAGARQASRTEGPLTPETAEVLSNYIKQNHLEGARPLFPTPRSGEPLGSKLLRQVLDSLGLQDMPSNQFRKDAASTLAQRIMYHGGSLQQIQFLLGHQGTTGLRLAGAYVQDLPFPSKIQQPPASGLPIGGFNSEANYALLLLHPATSAQPWVGLKPSENFAAQLASTEARVKDLGAQGHVLKPSFFDPRKGGLSLKFDALRSHMRMLGKAKIEDLPLAHSEKFEVEVGKLLESSELSVLEREWGEKALRLMEAGHVLQEAKNLAIIADINISRLKAIVGSKEAAASVKVLLAERKALWQEADALALGAERIFTTELSNSARNLAAMDRAIDKMFPGITGENTKKSVWGVLRDVMTHLGAGGKTIWRSSQSSAPSVEWLASKGISRSDTSQVVKSTGEKFMINLDDMSLDGPKRAAIVKNWIENAGIRDILINRGRNGIPYNGETGVFSVTERRLVQVLESVAKSVNHLFGDDFVKLSSEGKTARVKSIASEIVNLGYTEIPGAEAEKMLRNITAGERGLGRGGEGISPKAVLPLKISEPDPYVQDLLKTGRPFDDIYNNLVRPSDVVVKLSEASRAREGIPGQVTEVLRRVWEVVGLRGSNAHGVTRIGITQLQAAKEIAENTKAALSRLLDTPGGKKMLEAWNEAGYGERGLFKLELTEQGESSALFRKYEGELGGRELGVSEREMARRAMQHVKTIMDEDLMPLVDLREFYHLDEDQIVFIRRLRAWVAGATELAEKQGVDLKKLLGTEPSPHFFPSIARTSRRTKLAPADVNILFQEGKPLWTKQRQIVGGANALKEAKRQQDFSYFAPWDAASRYVAEVQIYASELTARQKMYDTGLIDSFRKYEKAFNAGAKLQRLLIARTAGKVFEEGSDDLVIYFGQPLINAVRKSPKDPDVIEGVTRAFRKVDEQYEDATRIRDITKDMPGVGGLLFKSDVEASKAREFFLEGHKHWLAVAKRTNSVSALLRFFQAGYDLSMFAIHGAVLLFAAPGLVGAKALGLPVPDAAGAWSKASWHALKALWDPKVQAESLRRSFDEAREFRSFGGMLDAPVDIAESASQAAEFLGRIPLAGGGMKSVATRMEAAFTVWQDTARIELWKSMKHMGKGDTKLTAQIAARINKMTGVYNPSLAGMPALQRYLEGSFLSFAPMYRRAAFGLLVECFRGDLKGNVALQTLGSAAAAMMITFGAMPKLMGNNEKSLDPRSPQFLSWKIGDGFVGVGTAYYSLMRASVALARQTTEDPGKFKSFDPRDNAMLKWWRSQAPPLPSAAIDLFLGETYIGSPLRGDDGDLSAPALAQWGMLQLTPIMMEAIARDVRTPQDAAIFLEGFGARSFPVSPWNRRRAVRDQLTSLSTDPAIVAWRKEQERGEKPTTYGEMPILFQRKLTKGSEDLQEIEAEILQRSLVRGRGIEKRMAEYKAMSDRNKAYIKDQLDGFSNSFAKGMSDPKQFRDLVGKSSASLRALQVRLANEYPDVTEEFDRIKEDKDPDSQFAGDYLFEAYMRGVMLNDDNTNEDGIFQPDVFEDNDSDFLQVYGLEKYKYVRERLRVGKDVPSLVRELWDAREALKPYWNLYQAIWKKGTKQRLLMGNYQSKSQSEQKEAREASPQLRFLTKKLERAKERFRRDNPELDWLLVKFYGNVPRTKFAEEQALKWADLQNRMLYADLASRA